MTAALRRVFRDSLLADAFLGCDACGEPTCTIYNIGEPGELALCERCFILARDTMPSQRPERVGWPTIIGCVLAAWVVWLLPLALYLAWQRLL